MNNDWIDDYLMHHGIRGQKWGDRNGPPYPLEGGAYSAREKKEIYKARRSRNNIYNKKHFDTVLEKDQVLSTLSYDPNRTKGQDMFYAAYTKNDKHQYNALFNKKMPTVVYDEFGTPMTTKCYKYRINNKIANDIKVASEDSGASAFTKLYSKNRDFSNFVNDPNRMQALFVESKYKFRGYREARDVLDKMKEPKYKPTEDDLRTVYRMFNYVIPSDGAGDKRAAKDIERQRARFFKELKDEGYGAVFDTNDGIYGGFKSENPVIVFDMSNIVMEGASRVTTGEKVYSDLVTAGNKILKLI